MTSSNADERVRFLTELMEKSVSDYEAARADLPHLVGDLESLLDSMHEVADPAWVAELREQWGSLEIIYAQMLAEDRARLTEDDCRDIAEAIASLHRLLEP